MDNAATYWPKPEGVASSINNFIEEGCANPGRSAHRMSIDTARQIFFVREKISELLGADDPLRIAFTNNATSALNVVIQGFLKAGDHVITSSMEHNSVMRPLRLLEKDGLNLTVVKGHSDGSIDPQEIRKFINPKTKAIIITHASNVTGTIMPVKEIAKIAQESGITFIVDGSQTSGAIPVNVIEDGIDIFAFTGHKGLMGPQGTGGLFITRGLEEQISSFITGGTGSASEREEQPEFMPDKFESGTPNSPGIIGLGKAVDFIQNTGIEKIFQKKKMLTGMFINGLLSMKNVIIYGRKDVNNRTSVISINIKGMSSSDVTQRLDEDFGILTRPGLHCAPSAHKTIGTFPGGTVRFSMGYFNTEEDVYNTLEAVEVISKKS